MPILGGRRMPRLFFAEINILRSADAVESKFIHVVPDKTSFWPSWSGGRECEYGADIDRRTTGLHSSSVTPDQSHHHHPFHTPSPLCSCPSLCMACEAAQMPSDSGRLSVGSRRRCLPADQSKLAGRSFGTSAECGLRATCQRLIDLLQFQKRPPRRLRQTSSAWRSHRRKLNC